MKILMLLFCRRHEGTYYRAWPWARYLAGRGHDVTLMCTSKSRAWTSSEESDSGVRLIETPNLMEGRIVMSRLAGMYGWSPLDIAQRCREVRRGAYDILHTFEHHLNVALPAYLRTSNRRPLLVCDGCDHYGKGGLRDVVYSPYRLGGAYRRAGSPLRTLMDRIECNLRLQADAVTVISRYLADRMQGFGVAPDRIVHIPGSAEIDRIRPIAMPQARKAAGLPPQPHILGFFGAGQLDLDMAFETFSSVRRTRRDLRFLLIGRRNDALAARARQAGLERDVTQTGWCPEARLPAFLSSASILLLPMRDHPVNRARWPNKIGAYMSAGRPTACTRVGDAALLVEQERIGVVSDPDASSLSAAVLAALDNPAMLSEMGRRARQVAEKQFALEVQGRQLEALYLKLMEAPRA
jgi:glycosyltransferase involved in cell wall biosynthesis